MFFQDGRLAQDGQESAVSLSVPLPNYANYGQTAEPSPRPLAAFSTPTPQITQRRFAPFNCRSWRNKIEQFIDLRSIWCAIIAPNVQKLRKKTEQKTGHRERRRRCTKYFEKYPKNQRQTDDGHFGIHKSRSHPICSMRFPLGLLLFSF